MEYYKLFEQKYDIGAIELIMESFKQNIKEKNSWSHLQKIIDKKCNDILEKNSKSSREVINDLFNISVLGNFYTGGK